MRNLIKLALILALSSCGSDSLDDGFLAYEFDDLPQASSCGAVVDGRAEDSVSQGDTVPVTFVNAPEGNVVILRDNDGNDRLIRLLGLSSGPEFTKQAAQSFIRDFSFRGIQLVPSGCEEELPNGARAAVASVFSLSGESLSEGLVRSGFVTPRSGDDCGGSRYPQCLSSIAASAPTTAGELSRFLWKPTSDNDSRLAIHTGPFGSSVIVSGEFGENRGPGNGYGSLARFNRQGCGYPSPQIQVLDSRGVPFTVNGQTTFSVPNPCDRWCVEGGNGQVVLCRK